MKLKILILILTTLLASCVTESEPVNTGVTVGDTFPEFSVTLSTGETVSNQTLQGKVSVLEFFNTSCADCREGLPAINDLYEEYKEDERVMIIAISREESSAFIEDYWDKNGFTLPYSAQTDRTVYNLFASTGIPRTYITDKSGKIYATFGDSSIPTRSQLNSILNLILNE